MTERWKEQRGGDRLMPGRLYLFSCQGGSWPKQGWSWRHMFWLTPWAPKVVMCSAFTGQNQAKFFCQNIHCSSRIILFLSGRLYQVGHVFSIPTAGKGPATLFARTFRTQPKPSSSNQEDYICSLAREGSDPTVVNCFASTGHSWLGLNHPFLIRKTTCSLAKEGSGHVFSSIQRWPKGAPTLFARTFMAQPKSSSFNQETICSLAGEGSGYVFRFC